MADYWDVVVRNGVAIRRILRQAPSQEKGVRALGGTNEREGWEEKSLQLVLCEWEALPLYLFLKAVSNLDTVNPHLDSFIGARFTSYITNPQEFSQRLASKLWNAPRITTIHKER